MWKLVGVPATVFLFAISINMPNNTTSIFGFDINSTVDSIIRRIGSVAFAVTFAFAVWKMACSKQPAIIVDTAQGSVRGSKMKSKLGKKIFAFRGIPYAKPPLGELRFRRSEPAAAWSGVLNCRREAKKSYQPNVLLPDSPFRDGGEDCLYLNVYTRRHERHGDGPISDEDPALAPVIVFLHGGAFVVGSCEASLYGPNVLLDRDNVVMVGVNYRLGALGFLSLECDEAPGNLGLHDQYLALRWIQENIAQFGGDPANVTLMGESAGAMSAACHLVSPLSRGLFHRVIALSGAASNVLLHNDRRPRCYALALAARLGYRGDTEDSSALLTFLQSKKSRDIIKASVMFLDWDFAFPMPWVPTVDNYAETPFIPQDFRTAVSEGNVTKVPVLFGLCQEEGYILTAPYYQSQRRWDLVTRDWSQWAPLLFLGRERDLATDTDRELMAAVASFYFGEGADMAQLPRTEANLRKLGRIYSMAYFYRGADRDSKLLAGAGLEVYNMVLCHPPAFSLMEMFRLSLPQLIYLFSARSFGLNPFPPVDGVCHGDDLNYLFPMWPLPESVVTEDQRKVRRLLLDLVTSFSSLGRPAYSDPSDGLAQVLQPLTKEAGISTYFKVQPSPLTDTDADMKKEIEFWNSVEERSGNDRWEPVDIVPSVLYTKIACQR